VSPDDAHAVVFADAEGLVLDLDALWSEVARLGPTERD
jgi:hypothetical protein